MSISFFILYGGGLNGMYDDYGESRGVFSMLYNTLSSLGDCFLLCCSFLLRILYKLFGKPIIFAGRKTVSFFSRINKNFTRAFTHENGEKKYFTGRLSRSFRRVLSYLPGHPLKALAVFYGYADKGTRVYAPVIRGVLCTIIPLIALLAVIITANTITKLNASLTIKSGETTVGCVADESVFFEARTLAQSRLSLAGGRLPALSYSFSLVPASNLSDAQTLAQALLEISGTQTVTACGIYIDGEFLCAVNSEAAARRVFAEKTSAFVAENDDDIIGFVEQITYVTGLYPNTSQVIWSTDKLAEKVKSDNALLTLKAVRTVVNTQTVAYPTVYIETDSLLLGNERVVVTGADGVDQVTSFVTYIDGEAVSSNEVARLTVTAPVTQRIQTGTRLSGGDDEYTYFGGILIWPTIGATNINSPYGYRWGRLHGGLDLGCAYGTSYGKSVVAAAQGTVIIASYGSILGYYVKIDHGNGMQTLYAHMQAGSLCVSAGDKVYAGEQIGKIGTTGYVTGPHLHFEVWKNGSRVDPGLYLGLY